MFRARGPLLLTIGPAEASLGSFSVAARLDAIDRQILEELQEDGRITNVELARRVGISAPPCLRRGGAPEQAGSTQGYRARPDAKLLASEGTAFAPGHPAGQTRSD